MNMEISFKNVTCIGHLIHIKFQCGNLRVHCETCPNSLKPKNYCFWVKLARENKYDFNLLPRFWNDISMPIILKLYLINKVNK